MATGHAHGGCASVYQLSAVSAVSGQFFDVKVDGPVYAITDNKAAYDVIRQPGTTKRTAHFSRWLHFARELYLLNKVEIILTVTNTMPADILTKPGPAKAEFLKHRAYIMNLA